MYFLDLFSFKMIKCSVEFDKTFKIRLSCFIEHKEKNFQGIVRKYSLVVREKIWLVGGGGWV